MTFERLISLCRSFIVPLVVFGGLILALFLNYFHLNSLFLMLVFLIIGLGSYDLVKDTIENIKEKQFGLDYIAILAVLVAIVTHEYIVAAVIALMLATGRTLEKYGSAKAKASLTALAERIPQTVIIEHDQTTLQMPIGKVKQDDIIMVRKGEVIPLDGDLLSESAIIDESSLTGEAYPVDKIKDNILRSGTINVGNSLRLKVTKEEKDSSYNKILSLVRRAQQEKAPLVRLANKYSVWFTIITLMIALIAFLFNQTLESVLAVLVVATPCPLILATPVALMGGMNKAAKQRVIIKKLASIEALARVNAVIFDKTGTITFGKPSVVGFTVYDTKDDSKKLLAISEAIERNSLHPLAKAIVRYAAAKNVSVLSAIQLHEEIGKGISGIVQGKKYTLAKIPESDAQMTIGLYDNHKLLAAYSFEDQIKPDSKKAIQHLQSLGVTIAIYTGDKLNTAEKLIAKLGIPITLKAECKPEDKQAGIVELKKQGKITAMIGDGINDAPALAIADVGMVFSNEEQTAASEAADIVFLGGDFSIVIQTINDAKRTISIARQSILWGIGMSILFMLIAAIGLIPPIVGAIIQEVIDIVVIINALRASR